MYKDSHLIAGYDRTYQLPADTLYVSSVSGFVVKGFFAPEGANMITIKDFRGVEIKTDMGLNLPCIAAPLFKWNSDITEIRADIAIVLLLGTASNV
ncbi:MAG: hypothetical protein OEL89_01625 [Candidatus Peregrinibacteria bacterium]|nr:hypothetical protein [Candidatus Peregrinibacteria bacterium]